MVRAGASGYMLKECVFDDLVRAIKAIMDNQSYLSPQIASIVLEGITKDCIFDSANRFREILTLKENQILQLLTEGHSAKQIAAQLSLSVKTIEAHRAQIMRKLDIHNVAELTKYAIREGLTSL
jgi:DNA-binding NarL/FixJ family response regulator